MPQRNGQHPVVVVGGGIVGSAIAVHLLDHGIRPVLIDPEHAGDTASALSFASITAFDLDRHAHYDLARAGMADWPRLARRLGHAGEVGYQRGGQVRWAADPVHGQALTSSGGRGRWVGVATTRSASCC